MKFLYPQFLWALSFLAIPVIIHLFNFRKYKQIYFSNIFILKNIKEEKKPKSNLKHLILLLLRLLFIASLVFAFSQPYIPLYSKQEPGQKSVGIYIDNSFSMKSLTASSNNQLIEIAKEKAKKIVNSLPANSKLYFFTNNYKKYNNAQSKELVLDLISQTESSPYFANFKDIVKHFNFLTKKTQKQLYILSDFQKKFFDLKNFENDTNTIYILIPIQSTINDNIAIDSCFFSSPVRQFNKSDVINVVIHNYGSNDVKDIPVKLFINNEIQSINSVDLKAGENKTISLNFWVRNKGKQMAKVLIEDYPVDFDNSYYFTYNVPKQFNILVINDKNDNIFINKLFDDTIFNLKNNFIENAQFPVDYYSLSKQDIIILNNVKQLSTGLIFELKRFVENGGNILIFPPYIKNNNDLDSILLYNEILPEKIIAIDTSKKQITKIDINSNIFKNVFKELPKNINLPQVYFHYVINENSRILKRKLLELENNDAFITEYPFKKGKIYFCSSPLQKKANNFMFHSIFVPSLLNITIYSVKDDRISYKIGEHYPAKINIKNKSIKFSETAVHLINSKLMFDIIPQYKINDGKLFIYQNGNINKANFYYLLQNNDTLSVLAYNYDRNESNILSYSKDELQSFLNKYKLKNFFIFNGINDNIELMVKKINKGNELWIYLIIASLFFLILESTLASVWK